MLVAALALFPTSPVASAFVLIAAFMGALGARLLSNQSGRQSIEQDSARETGASALAAAQAKAHAKGAFAPLVADAVMPPGALLEATMDSMREGALVLDRTTRVLAANRAAQDVFGASNSSLRARRLSELTRHPSILSAFSAALERGERAEVVVEIQAGERRIYDLRVAPLRQRVGREITGAIGVLFDITRLEKLERVRQEFLSNVSHELRTPLTAILTFVETLESGAIDDPENNRRFLAVIRRNAARMHSLIDDILELSAIEAGTVTVEAAPVRLHPLVNDVLTALAPRAEERSITLQNTISPETIVQADARRLEQMLTNLLDNAIKFNHEGGSVTVAHEEGTTRDRIFVSDTGDGIAPEHIERIFERFYRIDRARSRALGGTGLGLAIVKHLARAHGGEATVRSALGQGSTFTIELPQAVISGKKEVNRES